MDVIARVDVLQSTVTETVVSKQVVVVDFHSIKIMSCGLAGDAPFKVSFIYVGVSTVRREPVNEARSHLSSVVREKRKPLELFS